MFGVNHDPYALTSYIGKLQETKTIVLTDLDGTFATKESGLLERQDRKAVRKFLKQKSFVAGAVTARTPSLTMSCKTFDASRQAGTVAEEPHCGFDASHRRVYVPLEELPFNEHCLDWDAVAGVGSGILLKRNKGYRIDHELDLMLKYDYAKGQTLPAGKEPMAWREAALLMLRDIWPEVGASLAPIEFSQNYRSGVTDVMPLPYRLQLHFHGRQGLERLTWLKEKIRWRKFSSDPVAMRIATVDESRPQPNPEKSAYVLYLMPHHTRKEKLINRLLERSAVAAGLNVGEVKIFYAGDTPTDLRAGLYANGAGKLTFLLAAGSPLMPYLLERRPCFGGESLEFMWYANSKTKHRFAPTNERGVYTFRVSGRPWTNTIVLGDERYPGTTAPGSVLAFLEEFANANAPH